MKHTLSLLFALSLLTPAGTLAQTSIGEAGADSRALGAPTPGRIETDEWLVRVSPEGGGVLSVLLKKPRFHVEGKPSDRVTTNKPEFLPFAVELAGKNLAQAGFALTQLGPRAVRLETVLDGVRIVRKLEAGKGPYQLWITTRLENLSSSPQTVTPALATHHYVPRAAESGGIPLLPAQSPARSNGLCHHGGELERDTRDDLAKEPPLPGPIGFAGIDDVYFLNAIAPWSPGETARCERSASDRGRDAEGKPIGTLLSARIVWKPITLARGGSRVLRALGYIGPKAPDELGAAGHDLKQAIEGGWFASLAEGLTWLLRVIHDRVGNWGIAIILLTLLVKTVLFPLTAKQMHSMARMKELKPELDRINALYADDREKKGAAIMELYRKRSINPMAGCFPVLLQLPIWFSLYASLSSNVELLRAPFALWWTDLSSPDPYFTLPLALGALMFVQQKMSPAASADPVQQKMMLYLMPGMMTSFMLFLPAGLCLYMFTNSALSIGQQRLIEAQLASRSAASANPGAPSSDAQDSAQESEDAAELSKRTSYRPSKAERRSRRGKR